MNRLRKLVSVAAVAVLLAVLPGCNEQLTGWCNTYSKGYSYVSTYAIPALDIASGLKPEWSPQYEASKTLLASINDQLVAFCIRHSNGEPVSPSEVGPLVAQGSVVIADMITLYQKIQTGSREPGRATSINADALKAEMLKLSADAGRR